MFLFLSRLLQMLLLASSLLVIFVGIVVVIVVGGDGGFLFSFNQFCCHGHCFCTIVAALYLLKSLQQLRPLPVPIFCQW